MLEVATCAIRSPIRSLSPYSDARRISDKTRSLGLRRRTSNLRKLLGNERYEQLLWRTERL